MNTIRAVVVAAFVVLAAAQGVRAESQVPDALEKVRELQGLGVLVSEHSEATEDAASTLVQRLSQLSLGAPRPQGDELKRLIQSAEVVEERASEVRSEVGELLSELTRDEMTPEREKRWRQRLALFEDNAADEEVRESLGLVQLDERLKEILADAKALARGDRE